jgi:L,D-peptidoglycan transpeptidase YkuD (ErfK/YbiS/YcfS/YnhG family)
MIFLDHIIVRKIGPSPHDGHLQAGELSFRCALGSTGITNDKREGDGATPLGRFLFRHGYFRHDRLPKPETGLAFTQITALDGWSDDPQDPDYNRFIRHPDNGKRAYSAEHLWRDDEIYDLIVVIGHNDNPPIPGAGSAIFMHIARPDYSGTEGCVALSQDDLLSLLPLIGPDTTIDIQA